MFENLIFSIDLEDFIKNHLTKENDWILIDLLNKFHNTLLKRENTSAYFDIISNHAFLLRDLSWEKLHTGHWKDVPIYWRDVYTLSQIYANLSSLIKYSMLSFFLKKKISHV